jgi:hypothetical protein
VIPLQVFGVKPFGEPMVNFRQQFVSFSALALLLPEASKARSGSEFQRLCLLSAGNLQSLQETRFGFAVGVGGQEAGVGVFRLVLTCLDLP